MRREAKPIEYRPEWLPEGYYETSFDVTSVRTRVVYTNVDNNTLRFVYMRSENEPYLFIDSSDAEIRNISINNYQGELFLADNPDVANAITWNGPDDTLFYISGFVSENELVMIAESVKSENN